MTYEIKYDGYAEYPSFPYISLEISNAQNEKYVPQKGKIDTGAYMTVIPEYLIKLLGLKSRTTAKAGGFGSDVEEHNAYYVHIKISDLVYKYLKVISQPDNRRPNILIGRDLINLWETQLDGQKHSGAFTSWSMNLLDAT